MNRLLTALAVSILLAATAPIMAFCSTTAPASVKPSAKHPRLIMNDREFSRIKKIITKAEAMEASEGASPALLIHRSCMKQADSYLDAPALTYRKDASNKRLVVCGECKSRLFVEAYAYRYTGDKKYLQAAEKIINDVCDFPD